MTNAFDVSPIVNRLSDGVEVHLRIPFGFQLISTSKESTELVVLCRNPGTGYVPIKTCMQHQIYVHDLIELMEKFPGNSFSLLYVNQRADLLTNKENI